MADPNESPLLYLARDPEFQEQLRDKNEQRRGAESALAAKLMTPPDFGPIEQTLEAGASSARASAVVRNFEAGQQMGPDKVLGALDSYERTGDLTGKTKPGLHPTEYNALHDTLNGNEPLLDYFERHPEAALVGYQDVGFFQGATQAFVEAAAFVPQAAGAVVTGFQRDQFREERGDIGFKLALDDLGANRAAAVDRHVRSSQRAGLEAARGARAEDIPVELNSRYAEVARAEREFNGGHQPGPFSVEAAFETAGQVTAQYVDMVATGTLFAGIAGTAAGIATGAVGGLATGGPGVLPGFIAGAIPAAKVGFQTGAATHVFKSEFGNFYADTRIDGKIDRDAALGAAALYGSLSTLVELYAFNTGAKFYSGAAIKATKGALRARVMKLVGNKAAQIAMADIGRKYAKTVAAETGEEVIQTVLQLFLTDLAKLQDGSFADVDSVDDLLNGLTSEEGVFQIAAAGFGAATGTALFALPGLAVSTRRNMMPRIQQAAAETEFFESLNKGTPESTLKDKAPGLFNEFVKSIGDYTGLKSVFIKPEDVVKAFEQAGMGMAAAEQVLPGINEQIKTATEIARDVEIPMSTFAQKVVGTDLFGGFRSRIKLVDGAFSNEQLAELAKQDPTAELTPAQDAFQESANKVGNHIYEQLLAVGNLPADQARQGAIVARTRFATLASLLSSPAATVTPEDVFNLYPLDIRGETQATRGLTYNQEDGTLVENQSFRDRIQGTVVVDEVGKPRRVFHGTRAVFDDAFNMLSHFGTLAAANERLGFASSGERLRIRLERASEGENIHPVFLDIKRPLAITDTGRNTPSSIVHELLTGSSLALYAEDSDNAAVLGFANAAELQQRLQEARATQQSPYGLDVAQLRDIQTRVDAAPAPREAAAALVDGLEELGFDGFVYANTVEDQGSTSYVPFRGSQVIPLTAARAQDPEHFQQKGRQLRESSLTTEAKATPTEGLALPAGLSSVRAVIDETGPKLDALAALHPNPLISEAAWHQFFADALGVTNASILPPTRAIEWARNPNLLVAHMRTITPAQKASADEGLATAKKIGEAFANGTLGHRAFGQIVAWAALSKMMTASTHESGFLRALGNGLNTFIDKVVAGEWTPQDTADGLAWTEALFTAGSGFPAGAKSNLNSLFTTTFPKYAAARVNGRPLLQVLGDMVADPNTTAATMRRVMLTEVAAAGIQQKIVSFALLAAGRSDLLVMDRWQARNFWASPYTESTVIDTEDDDGKAVQWPLSLALYDRIPTGTSAKGNPTFTGLNQILTGPGGLAILEGLERGLMDAATAVYGTPDLSRLHWESWLIANNQEVGHASLDAILTGKTEGARVREGQDIKSFGDVFAIERGREVYYVRGLGNDYARYEPDEYLRLSDRRDLRRAEATARIAAGRGEGAAADRARPGDPLRNAAVRIIRGARQAISKRGTQRQSIIPESYRRGSPAFRDTDIAGHKLRTSVWRFQADKRIKKALELAVTTPIAWHELEPSRESADAFHAAILAGKASNKFGAAVYAYPVEQYEGMRLFLSENASEGFALKGDDIVSAFTTTKPGKPNNAAFSMFELAIQLGGRRADAFDTMLPALYAQSQMRVVARTAWDDAEAPKGWDKEVFKAFNNGEPDVVFLVFDPDMTKEYEKTDGPLVSYAEALAIQEAAVVQLNTQGRHDYTFRQPAQPTEGGPPATPPRGDITFTDEGAIMRLLAARDGSTFIHELGHYFVQQLIQLQQTGRATPAIDAQLDAIVRWTGVENVDQLSQPYADGRQFEGETDIPHEKLARAFEVYLVEGTAPVVELEGAFNAFRAWIVEAYQGVKRVAANRGIVLDKDVTDIFDRMLVVEREIDNSTDFKDGPLFTSAQQMGVDPPTYDAYVRSFNTAIDTARQKLAKQLLGRVRRERREARQTLRDQVRADVERAISDDPAWRALRWLKRGEVPEGSAMVADTNVGLDRESVQQLYGGNADRIIELLNTKPGSGRGRQLVAADRVTGLDPGDVADLFGFSSGRALVDAILVARDLEEQVDSRVNQEIAQRDALSLEPDAVEDAALQATTSLPRETVIRAELAALRELAAGTARAEAEAAQRGQAPPTVEMARERLQAAKAALEQAEGAQAVAQAQIDLVRAEEASSAALEARRRSNAQVARVQEIETHLKSAGLRIKAAKLVGRVRAGELRSQRRIWNTTALREAKKARKAIAAGEFGQAAEALERQLLAHHAVDLSNTYLTEMDKARKDVAKFYKKSEQDKLRRGGFDGAATIVKLLTRWDFHAGAASRQPQGKMGRALLRAAKKARVAANESDLLEFSAKAQAEGWLMDIDEYFLAPPDGVTSWKDLEVDHFRGLIATIKGIEMVSRGEVKGRDAARKLSLTEAAQAMADQIRAMWPVLTKAKTFSPDTFQKLLATKRSFDALLLKREELIDFMGGDSIVDNRLREFLWEPIQKASSDELDMQAEYVTKLREITGAVDWRRWNQTIEFESLNGYRGSYHELIAMALNRGNASNWRKLVEGYANEPDHQWTEAGILKAMELIEDEDWVVVQKVWDVLESLKPRIWKVHFDVTGTHPKEIEPQPFITPTGREMQGGYYPVVYDPVKDKTEVTQRLIDKAETSGMFGASWIKPDTDHGFVESRSESYSRPMWLDVNVMANHIEKVIHDVTHRQAIIQVYGLTRQASFRKAVRETWGQEYMETLDAWVQAQARERFAYTHNGKTVDKLVRGMRSNITMMGLGYRFSTVLLQPIGLLNSAPEVGPGWLLRSVQAFASNPGDRIDEVVGLSREMRHRFGNNDRDMRNEMRLLKGQVGVGSQVKRFAFHGIAYADMMVSTITWRAQFEHSMDDHGNQARAIREADRAVRRSQGSGLKKDLVEFQEKGGAIQFAAMFYSYASALYAQQRRAALTGMENNVGTATRKRDLPRALARWLMSIAVPQVMASLLAGYGPDDDEAWEVWFAQELVSAHVMPLPFFRDVVAGTMTGRMGQSPLTRMFSQPIALANDLVDDDLNWENTLRHGLSTVGYLAGYPLGQPEIWIDNFWEGSRDFKMRDIVYRRRKQ